MKNKDQNKGKNSSEKDLLNEGLEKNNTIDFNQNDADFIKKNFETNFQSNQPPKFTWDKIEQHLESTANTDSVVDFSIIKQSFDTKFTNTNTPTSIWNEIETKMDNSLSDDSDNLNFIKDSFEKRYDGVLQPLFSWDDLSKRIDKESVDFPINQSIIKDSFEENFKYSYPNQNTWSEIERKLNKSAINNSKPAYYFKRIATFSLLLLLCKTCIWDNYNALDSNKSNVVITQHTTPSKNLITDNEHLKFRQKAIQEKNDQNTAATDTQNNDSSEEIDLTLTNANNDNLNNNAYLKLSEQNKNKASATIIPTVKNNSFTFGKVEPISLGYTLKHLQTNLNNASLIASANLIPIENRPYKKNHQSESNLTLEGGNINSPITYNFLKGVEVDKISQNSVKVEHVKLLENNTDKHISFELGLIGKMGTSILTGTDVSNEFDSKSFSSSNLLYSGNMGLIVICNLDFNNSLIASTTPYNSIKYQFGNFTNNGYYNNTSIELSFIDFSIGYQRNLFSISNYNSFTKLYARSELGLSILAKETTTATYESNLNDEYFNKTNLQLGLSIGSSHKFNQFIVDYGLSSQIGLFDIVKNDLINPNISSAHLLNLGGYISVRYTIPLKINASRKTIN